MYIVSTKYLGEYFPTTYREFTDLDTARRYKKHQATAPAVVEVELYIKSN